MATHDGGRALDLGECDIQLDLRVDAAHAEAEGTILTRYAGVLQREGAQPVW